MKVLALISILFLLPGCVTMRQVAYEDGHQAGIAEERARLTPTMDLYKRNARDWQKMAADLNIKLGDCQGAKVWLHEANRLRQRLQDCLDAGSLEK